LITLGIVADEDPIMPMNNPISEFFNRHILC